MISCVEQFGKIWIAGTNCGNVVVQSATDRKTVFSQTVSRLPIQRIFKLDGEKFIATTQLEFAVFSVSDGIKCLTCKQFGADVVDVCMFCGKFAFACANKPRIEFCCFSEEKMEFSALSVEELEETPVRCESSLDGQVMAVVGSAGKVVFFDKNGRSSAVSLPDATSVTCMCVNQIGSFMAVAQDNNTVSFVHIPSSCVLCTRKSSRCVLAMTFPAFCTTSVVCGGIGGFLWEVSVEEKSGFDAVSETKTSLDVITSLGVWPRLNGNNEVYALGNSMSVEIFAPSLIHIASFPFTN